MAAAVMDILVDGQKVEEEGFLRGSQNRESPSHSRSSSFKNRRQPKLTLDIKAAQRPRTNSLPTPQLFLTLPQPDWMPSTKEEDGGLCRVRSFKTTSKGIVNRGDSFKRSTHSLASNGSMGSNDQLLSCASGRSRAQSITSIEGGPLCSYVASLPAPPYKVFMMGTMGSGKSSLTRQFMTSEYKGTYENISPDVETDRMSVSVLLDGEESVLEFIDEEKHPDVEGEDIPIDAYVIVFSVIDSGSYNYAVNSVRKLRVECGIDRAIILVANKIDLARQRRVTKHDAVKLATKYDCRYMETSAALNHHVDELLVGILSQIRQNIQSPDSAHLVPAQNSTTRSRSKSPGRAAIAFFHKLFGTGGSKSKSKSSENLFVK